MGNDERRRRPRVFDVWALPLGNGLYGHLQVLGRHPEYWHLVQVFDAVTPHPLPLADVLAAPALLTPLFTYISPKTTQKSAAVWVGNAPVEFTYPRQRAQHWTVGAPQSVCRRGRPRH